MNGEQGISCVCGGSSTQTDELYSEVRERDTVRRGGPEPSASSKLKEQVELTVGTQRQLQVGGGNCSVIL
jgi:hypothetical protein